MLRLAINGRLQLSVYFVNYANARCGKLVPVAEAEYDEVPPDYIEAHNEFASPSPTGRKPGHPYPAGVASDLRAREGARR